MTESFVRAALAALEEERAIRAAVQVFTDAEYTESKMRAEVARGQLADTDDALHALRVYLDTLPRTVQP